MLTKTLASVKTEIYDRVSFSISNVINELEGKKYEACRFELNDMSIVSRTAKITPKKIGQFVTFWKRDEEGKTTAFSEDDKIDFYVINVKPKKNFGQFVIPKTVLIEKGILSTKIKEGKRGFRVYPKWDEAQSKQAIETQKWQLEFFYEIGGATDLIVVKELYFGRRD